MKAFITTSEPCPLSKPVSSNDLHCTICDSDIYKGIVYRGCCVCEECLSYVCSEAGAGEARDFDIDKLQSIPK